MQICQNIKQARLLSGASQQEVANKLGIDRDTYKNWEIKTAPDLATINRIGKAIGVAPISLLYGIIDFTQQEVIESVEKINQKKSEDVLTNLARLTLAIGQLTGLSKEQILNSLGLPYSLDKTEVVVSEDLRHKRKGK